MDRRDDEPKRSEHEDVTRTADGAPSPGLTDLPESIGGYRVLGKLGEGGMGVVYEAEQQNPKRRVAVKVVRGGQFVDESRVRAFQREADTLARLTHPNIGGIHESGRTEDGMHFFAMELVHGETLSTYLEQRGQTSGLSPKSSPSELRFRLALIRKIADAVHYAHQRGVIHRDLKPSNIVVTERGQTSSLSPEEMPEVKILDFGLARITEGDIAAATMTTEVGMIKGTLPYMSPEQARGNPDEIDIRSDVYALGVILYEMLAGQRPYDVSRSSLPEAVRVICEEPPRSLSQSMSGARRLDTDIETIVGKALEKEVERRYASAAALSEDIGRYLSSQPILARPPSGMYQLRKFAARNKALVGGIAATFVVLLAGIIASTVLGLREASQRRAAVEARDDLQTVVDFQRDMLRGVDPERMGRALMEDLRGRMNESVERGIVSEAALGNALDVLETVSGTTAGVRLIEKEILEPAGARVEADEGLDPLIAAALHRTLGSTSLSLGLYDRAERHLKRDVEILEQQLGPEAARTLMAKTDLAWVLGLQANTDEAERILRDTLAKQERLYPDDELEILRTKDNLGGVLDLKMDFAGAVSLYGETLEGRRRLLGNDHPDTVMAQRHLAFSLHGLGEDEEAERLYLDAIERGLRLFGEDHPGTLSAMTNLGAMYEETGRPDKAEELYLETLEIQRRTAGEDHPATLIAQHNLGSLYLNQGRPAKAEEILRRTLEQRREILGELHDYTMQTKSNLALAYWDLGRDDEAEMLLTEVLDDRRRVLGREHVSTIEAASDLGVFYIRHNRHAEAVPLFERQIEILRRQEQSPKRDRDLYFFMVDLANIYKKFGRFEDAQAHYEEALEGLRAMEHRGVAVVSYNLACLAALRGDRRLAIDALRGAVEAGFKKPEHIQNDPDLVSLRLHPEFDEIIALAAAP